MDFFKEILAAQQQLKNVVNPTPLHENANLSEQFGATILLKREDMNVVRSYKIRGAYNKISTLTAAEKHIGIVCASAGNHAQGVAYSCNLLQIFGKIFCSATFSDFTHDEPFQYENLTTSFIWSFFIEGYFRSKKQAIGLYAQYNI